VGRCAAKGGLSSSSGRFPRTTRESYVQFQGYGLITGVQLVTQFTRDKDQTLNNFVFDFAVLSLQAENEVFKWDWISKRRNAEATSAESLASVRKAWRRWIEKGPDSLETCRRYVSKLLTVGPKEQRPESNSAEQRTLEQIYKYYDGRKHRFEALAAEVTRWTLVGNGPGWKFGWITPASSDGGADFIGRLDIGSGFGKTKLVILGQAKCKTLNTATGGNDVARTVARLNRGWVGVYVTTSFFSEKFNGNLSRTSSQSC